MRKLVDPLHLRNYKLRNLAGSHIGAQMEPPAKRKCMLPGYFLSLQDKDGRKRYMEKLMAIGGVDPYEIPKNEWQDDIDLWPGITYINLGMYLLLTPSPYTGEDLMNYKSLECYKNFVSGWVREVLVKDFSGVRAVIGKVRI